MTSSSLPDHLWRPLTQHKGLRGTTPPHIVSGKGCYITDNSGRQMLDGLSGLWCVNVGYGRRELAEVAAAQMESLCYLAPIMTNGPVVELADKLSGMLGMDGQVYFSVSGSEANETAFKIARQYHLQSGREGQRRYKIISRYRAYHGNTMAAMAATGQAERKAGYDPEPTGFIHVHPPYIYRRNSSMSPEEHGAECAHQLEETIIHEGAESIAAFIMEPVISGGGVLVPPDNYIPAVRKICDRYGILLIFDEVVSGFGRLGTMFGYERWGEHADIFTFAKGLASGYMPIAATVVNKKIFERFDGEPGGMDHFRQINTFGGHPVAAAVTLANLQIVEDENLTENAANVGDHIRGRLREELDGHANVGDIRGLGMLTGIELVSCRESKAPIEEQRINAVLGNCIANGVLLGKNSNTIPGRCNVVLIAPPLIVNEQEADRIIDQLVPALKAIES